MWNRDVFKLKIQAFQASQAQNQASQAQNQASHAQNQASEVFLSN